MPLLCAAQLFGCADPNADEESISNAAPAESAVNYALDFDGQNDYATLGTARFAPPTVAQTISLWVRVASVGSVQDLLTLRRDDSGNEFGLSETGVPTMWRIWGKLVLVESSEPIGVGQWHHLAYVYDVTQHAIYVDGILKGTGSNTPNNHSPTSGWLGTFNGTENLFAGRLDELQIWAVARSAAELQAEVEQGGPKSDPDLVGCYSFNEDIGTRTYDRSGNGNHATLGDGLAEYMPTRVVSDRP